MALPANGIERQSLKRYRAMNGRIMGPNALIDHLALPRMIRYGLVVIATTKPCNHQEIKHSHEQTAHPDVPP
jgi:hypothetical protein